MDAFGGLVELGIHGVVHTIIKVIVIGILVRIGALEARRTVSDTSGYNKTHSDTIGETAVESIAQVKASDTADGALDFGGATCCGRRQIHLSAASYADADEGVMGAYWKTEYHK